MHKGDKIEYDEHTLTDEVIIKYSLPGRIIAIFTYTIFEILGIFFMSCIRVKFNFMTVLILVLLTAFIVYFIIKIISATIISIDGKGIQVRECIRYLWNDIQLEKITVKHLVSRESKHDYRPEMNYLYFFHKGEKIEINIDDFDMTDYQLSQV